MLLLIRIGVVGVDESANDTFRFWGGMASSVGDTVLPVEDGELPGPKLVVETGVAGCGFVRSPCISMA